MNTQTFISRALLLATSLAFASTALAQVKTDNSLAPLLVAAKDGKLDELERLLAQGASLKTADTQGYTALLWAASEGQDAVVAALLDKHHVSVDEAANEGLTSLNWAAYKGHASTARLLVEHHANVNAQGNTAAWTPLMNASATGHADIAKYLLDHGAKLALRSKDDWSALDYAAGMKHPDIAKLLIAHGADPVESLAVGARRGNLDQLSTLLEVGAKVNAISDDGTALYWAAKTRQPEAVELLLARGADPNIVAPNVGNNASPLMWAAYFCNAPMAAKLISAGAKRGLKNREGKTAWDLASGGGTGTTDMKACADDVLALLKP